jgi:hypothetical protein
LRSFAKSGVRAIKIPEKREAGAQRYGARACEEVKIVSDDPYLQPPVTEKVKKEKQCLA